jgi:hypothetical protein
MSEIGIVVIIDKAPESGGSTTEMGVIRSSGKS